MLDHHRQLQVWAEVNPETSRKNQETSIGARVFENSFCDEVPVLMRSTPPSPMG